jgi:hypothetical protein
MAFNKHDIHVLIEPTIYHTRGNYDMTTITPPKQIMAVSPLDNVLILIYIHKVNGEVYKNYHLNMFINLTQI